MGLVSKDSIFFPKPQDDENDPNGALIKKLSEFVPLKFTKYDPTSTRFIGGSAAIPNSKPPTPGPPPPTPLQSFSNAFSNAFNI
jgi:hypothetical protein